MDVQDFGGQPFCFFFFFKTNTQIEVKSQHIEWEKIRTQYLLKTNKQKSYKSRRGDPTRKWTKTFYKRQKGHVPLDTERGARLH